MMAVFSQFSCAVWGNIKKKKKKSASYLITYYKRLKGFVFLFL